jgi:hypothetical protein
MKKYIIILSSVILFITGCSKENELKKSVMIYDPEYTDLPAYSEWGYNTFGAYYDREVFIWDNSKVPAKVSVNDNITSFVLEGQRGAAYYYSNPNAMTMTFKWTTFAPEKYSDLALLNDTVFNLANPEFQVIISYDTMEYTAQILSGELYFKRAQNLLVDKIQTEVILSGYFEFKALINEQAVTVSNGRFDVGIGPDNFYNY